VAGTGNPPAAAAEPAEYRFVPGDVLEVTITPQRSFDRTITVQPDGKVSYPIAGQLQAAGLTVEEFTARLREALNQDLVDPQVSISLKERGEERGRRVSLLGAVRSPNTYEIGEGTTLAEVLARAGGPVAAADLGRVTITRANGAVITVDWGQTERSGRLEQNVVLQAGDIIVVPEGAPRTVLVLGEVVRPGPHSIPQGARLLDALSLAGGTTPKADLRRVTVARSGAAGTQTLDLQPLLEQGNTSKPELNVPLQPGATIVIAESDQRVYVLGRVNSPDTYRIKPTDRVLDALVMAGGPAPDSNLSKAVLIRRGANGQPVSRPLDLKRIVEKGGSAENELLQPGDLLYVPDKKERRSPTEALSLFLPLTGLLGLFRN
jgi:polysaccharide export outer membrane protein